MTPPFRCPHLLVPLACAPLVLGAAAPRGLAEPAAPAARSADGPDPKRVGEAIDKGVAFLTRIATADDGRHVNSVNQRPGVRALILYTLLKGGASASDPLVQDLVFGLTEDTIDQTYDAACMLLALEAHDGLAHRAWIESLAQKLIDWQEPSGAWSYPGLVIDLSNTQYAALGLWAASKAGVDVPVEVWRKLAESTFEYHSPDGGFSYTAPPGGSTGSMTTAGVGVLALCEQELALHGALDGPFAAELAARRKRGLDWLDARFAVDTNPALGGFHYYYLYGLERMGALAGVSLVGAHDWYAEGATWLLGAQNDDGAWEHGSDLADTCFAVLFLERATGRAKRRVAMSGPKRQPAKTDEVDAAVRVACRIEQGVAIAHVASLAPSKARAYVWPGEDERGPRVTRVEYFIGDVPAGITLGAPERPADVDSWPAFLRPRAEGELVARVHFALPPGAAADLAPFLESPPLKVEWPEVLTVTSVARGAEALPARSKTKASSELSRSKEHPERDYGGEAAVDGNPATPWLTKVGDHEPSLRVQPRGDARAIGVTIAPPTLPGRPAAPLARPTKVKVILNGKSKDALVVDLAPVGRTRVLFDGPVSVKSVEVQILETDPPFAAGRSKERGAPKEPPTGFGEIGLIAAPPRR
ncbi:MAG: hypothetical protein R3F49_08175 [Planctomycetota bacterium]